MRQGTIAATRAAVAAWPAAIERPWVGALEATMFTGWVYDQLRGWAQRLEVAYR